MDDISRLNEVRKLLYFFLLSKSNFFINDAFLVSPALSKIASDSKSLPATWTNLSLHSFDLPKEKKNKSVNPKSVNPNSNFILINLTALKRGDQHKLNYYELVRSDLFFLSFT